MTCKRDWNTTPLIHGFSSSSFPAQIYCNICNFCTAWPRLLQVHLTPLLRVATSRSKGTCSKNRCKSFRHFVVQIVPCASRNLVFACNKSSNFILRFAPTSKNFFSTCSGMPLQANKKSVVPCGIMFLVLDLLSRSWGKNRHSSPCQGIHPGRDNINPPENRQTR